MSEIIWQAQPKQAEFMRRMEYECLYGGAAGGGKSDALLMEALRQIHIPQYRALILRKTFPQLAELIDRSRILYGAAFPNAKFNESRHFWRFPSGAQIHFGSMQHPGDRAAYQGRRFDYIAFDELTHFSWEEYSYMFSRNRPSSVPTGGTPTRCYIRAATNPGGVGHSWVKARFIDPAPPLTPIDTELRVPTADGGIETVTRKRVFVPSTVFDNRALLDADPGYAASLAMLPRAEKEALLYGRWDSFAGQVFSQWRDDPEHYEDRLWTHVISPFMPPKHWKCWRGFDFGYSRPFSVGWYVADERGKLYRIREYYGSDGSPNRGLEMDPTEIARQIRVIESEDSMLRGREIIGVADPAIFDESRGLSVAQMMAAPPNFVLFHGGKNNRLSGKMQMHYRLRFDEDGEPMFQVFSTCVNFIRTLPALCYSQSDVEDVDTSMEDHAYDEARYVMMELPVSPPKAAANARPESDPLNMFAPKGAYRGRIKVT